MESLTPNELLQQSSHAIWLEQARTMADQPSAVKAGLPLEVAYQALATFTASYYGMLTPSARYPGESVAEMNPAAYFGIVEAIDTILSHGEARHARKAATFAAELASTLPLTAQPWQRGAILENVLGITLASDTPVVQQLVERRLLPGGDLGHQMILIADIDTRMRVA